MSRFMVACMPIVFQIGLHVLEKMKGSEVGFGFTTRRNIGVSQVDLRWTATATGPGRQPRNIAIDDRILTDAGQL